MEYKSVKNWLYKLFKIIQGSIWFLMYYLEIKDRQEHLNAEGGFCIINPK